MENLQVTLDFETATALSNAITLAQQIRALREEFSGLGDAVGTAEGKLAKFASTSQQSVPPMQAVANQAQAGSTSFNQYNQQINVAVQSTQNLNTQTNTTINNFSAISTGTKQATAATSSLVGQVTSLVSAYFGLRAVINLMRELIDSLNKVREAQNALVDNKFEDDKSLTRLMANLGLRGAAGEAHARKLRNDLAAQANTNLARASSALEVTNASDIDVETAQGIGFAAELAKFGQRRDLDEDTIVQFARGAKQRGITDATGLKQLIAKGDAVFNKTLGINPTKFWRGAVAATGPEIAKGVDPDLAMAMYSAFVGESRDERLAALNVRQVANLAEAANPKTRASLAQQAAQMGLLKYQAVSDADVEGLLGSTKDGKQILAERRKLANEQGSIQKEESEFAVKLAKLQHSRHGKADIENAQIEHEEKLRRLNSQFDADNADYGNRLQGFRDKENSRRQVEAFQGMSLQDRLVKLLLPLAARLSGDNEAQNKFVEASGGILQRADDLFILGKKNSQRQIAVALAGQSRAAASDTDVENSEYTKTTPGQLTKTQTDQEIKNQNAVNTPGDTFNRLLDIQVEEQRKRNVAGSKYVIDADGGDLVSQALTSIDTDRQTRDVKVELLRKSMNDFLSDPNLAANAPERAQVQGLLSQLSDVEHSVGAFISSGSALHSLGNLGRQFGDIAGIRARVAQTKAAGSSPAARPAAPTTQPTTQPSGPVSINHYNSYHAVHIGNHWSGGDDDFDLPGRLENFG